MRSAKQCFFAVLLWFSVGVLVIQCGDSKKPVDSQLTDQEQIQKMYNKLRDYYNEGNVAALVSLYSEQYLHDGVIKSDMNDVWIDRIGDGSWQISKVEIQVTINGNLAECVADMYYTDEGVPDSMHAEPGGDDDSECYLRKESGGWKIYGNQVSSYMEFQRNGTPVSWRICKFWKSASEIEIYSGPSQQDDEDFEFRLSLTEGNLPLGTYSQNDRIQSMYYYEYGTIVSASITITEFDMEGRIVEGTVSATLESPSSQRIQISDGVFRAVD